METDPTVSRNYKVIYLQAAGIQVTDAHGNCKCTFFL